MSKQTMINTYAKESGRIWATHLDPRLGTWCCCTAPSPHWTRSLQKYTHAITTSPRTQPNSSNAQAEPVNQKPELTWDSGDDLPHLQPICEDEPKHTSGIRIGEPSPQIRGGPAEIRGGKGDETGGERLTEYGGLAGIVEAEDEDACLAVAEERREEPREHDAHGDARGLAPAAALGIRSSGLGAGRDLGFGGRGVEEDLEEDEREWAGAREYRRRGTATPRPVGGESRWWEFGVIFLPTRLFGFGRKVWEASTKRINIWNFLKNYVYYHDTKS
jgi:hypothetical protein